MVELGESTGFLTASKVNSLAKPYLPRPQELELFAARRAYIERAAFLEPRLAEKIDVEGGGEVRIVSSIIDLSQENQKLPGPARKPISERNTIHISVMNAGLFEATDVKGFGKGKGNTGNTEIKLAAGLFEGSDGFVPDAIVFIKPEGLNPQAYKEGQRLVGEAAATKLQSLVEDFKHKHNISDECNVTFDLTGYSEGSTQILSIAAAIDRYSLGSIRRVLSIGGAGFVGAPTGDEANPFAFVAIAIKEVQKTSRNLPKYGPYNRETSGVTRGGRVVVPDVHIPRRSIDAKRTSLTQYPAGYEFLPVQKSGVGTEKIVLRDDTTNIVTFGRRLLRTIIGETTVGKKLVGQIQEGAAVPWRRIKEACTMNADATYLAKQGVPVMIYADYDNIFFPPRLIKEQVQNLRMEYPDSNIWFVASKFGHAGPHYEQTAFNWLVEMLQTSWDRRMKPTITGRSG